MKSVHLQRGVTLIELIVVMIIVGILAAVAIPSYRNYLIRSQRSDAKDALLALATQQEKFYLQCNIYATDIAAAPDCAGPDLQGAAASQNGWYALAIDAADATSYTLSATAVAGENQFQDEACRTFRVNERGVRSAEDSAAADNTATCW
ncbi:MAG: type IV pilin protein [Gammaproteobacteria bacterium]|nr:type IV pilin protein [Gammaproteobacteria bacterium]